MILGVSVSCTDVVDLDLNEAAPRLVIDATMELDADGVTTSTVALSRTAGFYVEENPLVEDAIVTITDANGQQFTLPHTEDGIYTSTALDVLDNVDYTLTVIDQGSTFTSTQQLVRTVPIIDFQQETISGFGDDLVRITAFFNDPEGQGNFYLFEYNDELNEQVDIGSDEFTDGNRSPTIFFLEDFEVGMSAVVEIKGINQRCFNFYETLFQQSDGGGPFDAQPATVKGNIVNTTNPDEFPFGYFRISEVFTQNYVIQPLD
jgi:hypothetical protein